MSGNWKARLLRLARRRALQPVWRRLGHLARLGQNHWASSLHYSGELEVLDWLASRLPPKPLVFDVGANAGDYAREAARRLRPSMIHCFEPSAVAFAALERNTADLPVVRHRLALGSEVGRLALHGAEAGATTASLLQLRNPHQPSCRQSEEIVEVDTLDRFCAAEGIERIDFLKIDVEGFECAVLRGAERMLRERRIGAVQFEFGEGHIDARTFVRDFFDLLADFDFYRIVADGLVPLPAYETSLEVFACINYLAFRQAR